MVNNQKHGKAGKASMPSHMRTCSEPSVRDRRDRLMYEAKVRSKPAAGEAGKLEVEPHQGYQAALSTRIPTVKPDKSDRLLDRASWFCILLNDVCSCSYRGCVALQRCSRCPIPDASPLTPPPASPDLISGGDFSTHQVLSSRLKNGN